MFKCRSFVIKLLMLIVLGLPLASCGAANGPPLATVSSVDLQRYLGLWYEYASIPSFFQRGCTNTTAKYDRNSDGSIRVDNNCISNGKNKGIIGSATPQDSTNAKLTVSFRILGLFNTNGDYWVLGLGPSDAYGRYSWAVVGEKGRKYGWILSRTKTMSARDLAITRDILVRSGYDLTKFKKTVQN